MNRIVAYSCFVDAKPKFENEAVRWLWSLIEKNRVSPKDIYITCAADVSKWLLEFFKGFEDLNISFENCFTEISRPANKWLQLKILAEVSQRYTHVVLSDCDKVFVEFSPEWCDNSVRACRFIPRPTYAVFEDIFREYFNSVPRFIERIPDPLDELQDTRTYVNNHNGGLIIFPVDKLPLITEKWKAWIDRLLQNPEILRKNIRNLDQVALAVVMHEIGMDINFLPSTFDVGPKVNNISDYVLQAGSGQLVLHVHGSEDADGRMLYGDNTPDRYQELIDQLNTEFIDWKSLLAKQAA